MAVDGEAYNRAFADRMARMDARPMLDVHVCDHCNLRCAGCLHFAPLAEEHFLDLDAYERDLARLAAVEGIAGYFGAVALLGGEPLLHPRVDEVVRLTRVWLPGETVTLCTNGLLLGRMSDGFWDVLAECDVGLSLSAYPIGLDYGALRNLARSRGVRVVLNRDIMGHEAKEAFIRLALNPEGGCDPQDSFASCLFGGRSLQLARGAIWPCQVAAHCGSFARRFGYDLRDETDDSLPLSSLASTDDIETFRRRHHPLCRHCDTGALSVMPWERSKLSAAEWLA